MWRRAALSKRSCVYFETFLVCQRREESAGRGRKRWKFNCQPTIEKFGALIRGFTVGDSSTQLNIDKCLFIRIEYTLRAAKPKGEGESFPCSLVEK